MDELTRFKQLLERSTAVVGFTGAGVSTEAGISDYRSQGGIWERFEPVYLQEFIDDPIKRSLYWQRKRALWDSIKNAQPTAAHQFFSDLHRQGKLRGIVTQNIDGLHEKSGLPPEKIINLHGSTLEIICLGCSTVGAAEPLMEDLDPAEPPLCEFCGGLLKPNTISFGQQLVEADLYRAERLVRGCDLMIAAGSTLQVQPAASFPLLAKESGAVLAIITLSETPLDRQADFVFNEKLGSFLEKLEKI
jgi:NAD-dependent deacetylase